MDRIIDRIDRLEERIITKLDIVQERLTAIEKVDVQQTEQITEHIRRTNLNEENIGLLRKEFEPVKRHVELINLLAKVVAACFSVGGVVIGAVKLWLKG